MSAKKLKKGWIAFNFSDNPSLEDKVKRTTSKKAQTLVSRKVRGKPLNTKGLENVKFFEKLEPDKVEDLAVHVKKVKEVEDWLQCNVINAKNLKHTPMLLITGPTGSGKTTTLKLLCKTMKIDVQEWINPIDRDFELYPGPGQVSRLTDFLIEAKYPSLMSVCNNNKKISLIEDFPNMLLNNPQEFDNVLEICVSNGKTIIVFICTEVNNNNSLNMTKHMFTAELKDKYNISTISFNACSVTLLKAALKRAHALVERNLDVLKLPSVTVIDAIIASTMGDIRCAINQYYFACLQGTGELPTEMISIAEKEISGRKRKRSNKSSSVKSMTKDEVLGLFHSLGRVLNPKRTKIGDTWRFQCDLGALVDEFSMQPNIFNAFLHENYLKYFGDIEDLARAADVLSLSQTLMEKWIGQHDTLVLALWISVLGLMIYNEHRVSKWTPITGPKKANKVIENRHETKRLNPVDCYYYNVITRSEKFHKFKNT